MSTRWEKSLILSLILCGLGALVLPSAARAQECPQIHWIAADGSQQTYSPSIGKQYFDPGKSSLIYIHGFQWGWSNIFEITPRPQPDVGNTTFDCFTNEGGECFSYSYFKNPIEGLNFNVGIFYWNNLISTSVFPNPAISTEDRIWNDTLYSCGGGPNSARVVTQFKMEFDEVANISAQRIHIVAHSIGTQIVIKFLDQVAHAGSEFPYAVTLLEPAWVSTSAANNSANTIGHLLGQLDGGHNITTPIIMGKSTSNYWWGGNDSLYRTTYKIISEKIFDFWLGADFRGEYPSDDGLIDNFNTRHRRIVDYWFGYLAPRLWPNCYPYYCLYDPDKPHYPYDVGDQCGDWHSWLCGYVFWPTPKRVCFEHYWWLERVASAKGNGVMFFNYEDQSPESSCYTVCNLDANGLVDSSTCW